MASATRRLRGLIRARRGKRDRARTTKFWRRMRQRLSTRAAAQLTALLCISGLLSSCDKPSSQSGTSSNGQPGTQQAGTAGPVEIVTSSGIEMVWLPAGEFMMGSGKGNPDEAPAHRVKLSAFLIDKFEVTHEMFAKAQVPNPSHWQDNAKKPVERVRWRDAKVYCNERSLLEKLKPCYNEKTPDFDSDYAANGYRLPTEAEWEYACRAGTGGAFDFGPADKLRQFS